MEPRSDKIRRSLDKGRSDDASQRSHAIMLKNDEEGVLAASGAIEILNNIELPPQSKHPRAVGKQAMAFDHLVVSARSPTNWLRLGSSNTRKVVHCPPEFELEID